LLKYFKDDMAYQNKNPFQGRLACVGASLEEDTGFHAKAGHMFSMVDSFGRRLDLAASTENERVAWIHAVRKALHAFLHKAEGDGEVQTACSGWVYKRGDWRNPLFQKRWAVLTSDGWIKYYASKGESSKHGTSKGSISCERLVIEEDTGMSLGSNLFCFSITVTFGTSKRKMHLACDTDTERLMWVTNMKHVRDTMVHVHRELLEQDQSASQRDLNVLLYGNAQPRDKNKNQRTGVRIDSRINTVEDLITSAEKELSQLRRFHGSCFVRFRMAAVEMEASQGFSIFITGMILANMAIMSVESNKPNAMQVATTHLAEFFFGMVFGLECLVRLLVHTPRVFFESLWFCFDFFSSVTAFLVIGIDASSLAATSASFNPTLLRMFRLIKVIKTLRSLRLLKFLKGLNLILESLSLSLPVVFNLATLYFILLFFFGVIGIVLLGTMCAADDRELPGLKATRCLLASDQVVLEQFSSFKTMEISMLTLIRLTTGDGWASIMNRASIKHYDFPRPPDHLAKAAEALGRWNTTSPSLPRLKHAYLLEARSFLPGCATADELNYLRELKLVDCSALKDVAFETPCRDTCGSVFSLLVIPIFIFLAQCTIINLVIAALIVNLRKLGKKVGRSGKARITKHLSYEKFGRVYITWSEREGEGEGRRDSESEYLLIQPICIHPAYIYTHDL
jgi:hypothetical protein